MHKQRLGGPVWPRQGSVLSHRTDHSQGALMGTELPLRAGCGGKRLGKEEDEPRDWEHTDSRMEAALPGALGDAV